MSNEVESKPNNSIWCYMRKGWTAYVRGYKTYGSKYDEVDWGKGTKEPKEVIKDGNKTVMKFQVGCGCHPERELPLRRSSPSACCRLWGWSMTTPTKKWEVFRNLERYGGYNNDQEKCGI